MLLWVCFLEAINFFILVSGLEPQELMKDRFRGLVSMMNKLALYQSRRSLSLSSISEYP